MSQINFIASPAPTTASPRDGETREALLKRHADLNQRAVWAARVLLLLLLRAPTLVAQVLGDSPRRFAMFRLAEAILIGGSLFWAINRLSFSKTGEGPRVDEPVRGSRHHNEEWQHCRHRTMVRWHQWMHVRHQLHPYDPHHLHNLFDVRWLSENESRVATRLLEALKPILDNEDPDRVHYGGDHLWFQATFYGDGLGSVFYDIVAEGCHDGTSGTAPPAFPTRAEVTKWAEGECARMSQEFSDKLDSGEYWKCPHCGYAGGPSGCSCGYGAE